MSGSCRPEQLALQESGIGFPHCTVIQRSPARSPHHVASRSPVTCPPRRQWPQTPRASSVPRVRTSYTILIAITMGCFAGSAWRVSRAARQTPGDGRQNQRCSGGVRHHGGTARPSPPASGCCGCGANTVDSYRAGPVAGNKHAEHVDWRARDPVEEVPERPATVHPGRPTATGASDACDLPVGQTT